MSSWACGNVHVILLGHVIGIVSAPLHERFPVDQQISFVLEMLALN
jgi:hypothetical protein